MPTRMTSPIVKNRAAGRSKFSSSTFGVDCWFLWIVLLTSRWTTSKGTISEKTLRTGAISGLSNTPVASAGERINRNAAVRRPKGTDGLKPDNRCHRHAESDAAEIGEGQLSGHDELRSERDTELEHQPVKRILAPLNSWRIASSCSDMELSVSRTAFK